MANQPSIVRGATMADYDEVWRLCKACWAENGQNGYDHDKTDYTLKRFLDPASIPAGDYGPRGAIGVIGNVGALEGIIILSYGSMWYSWDINVDEYLNFVDPPHRSSKHAETLIAFAKHVVDELRQKNPTMKLIIGVLSTKRTAAKVRLYARQLTPAGAFFVHPPPVGLEPPRNLYRTM